MAWVSLLLQGAQALNQGQAQEQALKSQSIVASQQALADENAVRREGRAYRGSAAAALAENGLDPTGSSGRMVDQSAAMNELDALNTRYKGRLRALGLAAEGEDASRSGQMLAGQTLLKGLGDLYRSRNRGLIPAASGPSTAVTPSGFVGPR